MKLNRNSNYNRGGYSLLVFIALAIIACITLFGARHKIKSEFRQMLVIDKKEIEDIVANYIKENPKALIDSVEAWRLKMEEEARKEIQEKIKSSKEDLKNNKVEIAPFIGNPKGDVVLVTFLDYRCGFCKKSHNEVMELLKKDSNIKIYIKEFPVLGPQSLDLAKMALAVYLTNKDKYIAFHSALLEGGQYDDKYIDDLLTKLGLETKKVKEKMNDVRIQKELDATREFAVQLGVRGTPAFIFDEEMIPGAMDANSMLNKVNEIRKNKKR